MAPATIPHAEREAYLRQHIGAISQENFPDNLHNTWAILGFAHTATRTVVEVEPDPPDVGYERFKYMMDFSDPSAAPACIAGYALENGRFALLFSDPGWRNKVPRTLE